MVIANVSSAFSDIFPTLHQVVSFKQRLLADCRGAEDVEFHVYASLWLWWFNHRYCRMWFWYIFLVIFTNAGVGWICFCYHKSTDCYRHQIRWSRSECTCLNSGKSTDCWNVTVIRSAKSECRCLNDTGKQPHTQNVMWLWLSLQVSVELLTYHACSTMLCPTCAIFSSSIQRNHFFPLGNHTCFPNCCFQADISLSGFQNHRSWLEPLLLSQCSADT